MSAPAKRPAYEPAGGLAPPTPYDPTMKRPLSIVAGFVLVMIRVAVGGLWLASLAFAWPTLADDLTSYVGDLDLTVDGVEPEDLLTATIATGVVVLAVQAALGVFILFGRNWARIAVMVFSTLSIWGSFVEWWAGGQSITFATTLLALATDILILLALSSRSAAAYARRNQRP